MIYRKGVQCYKSSRKSLFHYDLSWASINESRCLESLFDVTWELGKYLGRHANKSVVKRIFDNYRDTLEGDEVRWQQADFYNDNWLDCINGRKLVRLNTSGYFAKEIDQEECLILPDSMVNSLSDYFKDRVEVLGKSSYSGDRVTVGRTERQESMLSEALNFLFNAGIEIKYPINVALFRDKNVLGSVYMREVFLSPRAFELGKKVLIETILEEVFHIESGLRDETRAFQDYLINKFVGLLEEKSNTYL